MLGDFICTKTCLHNANQFINVNITRNIKNTDFESRPISKARSKADDFNVG